MSDYIVGIDEAGEFNNDQVIATLIQMQKDKDDLVNHQMQVISTTHSTNVIFGNKYRRNDLGSVENWHRGEWINWSHPWLDDMKAHLEMLNGDNAGICQLRVSTNGNVITNCKTCNKALKQRKQFNLQKTT